MSKKKKKDKKKHAGLPEGDPESELRRLREENEMLRARLEKISEIAAVDTGEPDDEDDEYDEMTRDVDDLIDDGEKRSIEPTGAGID